MRRRGVRALGFALAVGAASVLFLGVLEYRFAFISGYRIHDFPMVRSPSFRLDLKQFLGLQEFYGQLGQDKWVIGQAFPGVDDGYFVDVGAWDAVVGSNSKALEELGWSGVCIEPFPRNWTGRSCQLFKEVVYSRPGEVIEFRMAGALGGIDEHLGAYRRGLQELPIVELTTTTLGDVLDRARAPRFIHFVSIDTEGSELEVLRGLPFDRYSVGAFAIEHNFEEPKRQRIRRFLEGRGYRHDREQLVDDWYVLADR